MSLKHNPFINQKAEPILKKKKRIFDEPESITKPIENHNETNYQKSITKPIENQLSINHQSIENELKSINQLSNKPIENQLSKKHQESINNFVGKERQLIEIIFQNCRKNGRLTTDKILTEELKRIIGLNANGIANLIFRVKEKKIIEIIDQKLGRVPYRIFKIEEKTYQELQKEINHNESIQKALEKPSKYGLDSSSIINNKEKELTIEIPENLSRLISHKELSNLLAKEISRESIEQSLKYFSYDYEHGLVKSKSSPLNMFYGILRGGGTYKSLKLIELENQELKEYQEALVKLENENQQLRQNELIKKYEDFKLKNPNFVNEVKAEQTMTLSEEILNKISFTKWKEEFGNEL